MMTNVEHESIRGNGVSGGVQAAVAASAGVTRAADRAEGKTYVLVAGGWHGGWCWRRVADLLEAQGHKVFAPTLTGIGERSHLLTKDVNLAMHIADVVNVIKWEGLKDIVLVGHSYAGFVIAGVAEEMQSAIGSIVFIDSFVPENGGSLAELASQGVRDAIAVAAQKGDIVLQPFPASGFRVGEKDRAWVDAMCTPHPLATLRDKVSVTGALERIAKKTYVRAKGYPNIAFDGYYDKLKNVDGWRTYEVASGHDPMIDVPEQLSDILLEVA
jgi:pimeloyl-ACP methyl ester carboxylesterase